MFTLFDPKIVQQALMQSPDAEVWLDAAERALWLNDATTRITGYSLQECQSMGGFPLALVYPNDRPLYDAMTQSAASTGQPSQAHFRLVGKAQAINWVTMTWQPMRDAQGHKQGTRIGIRDMALLSKTTSSPINHLLVYRQLAASISKQAQLPGHDLTSLCNYLVKAIAIALDVKQVGVWLFNTPRTHLCCVSLYSCDSHTHEAPADIRVADFPVYMKAIATDDLIVANDARRHETTAELTQSYLMPMGITSMLDAPIQQHGTNVGVLCIEHGPSPRQWAAAEGVFADALAEVIGQHLEAKERAQLAALSQRLVTIVNTTPDLVFTATLSGEVVYLNPSGRRLLGFGLNESIAHMNAMTFVPGQWREQRVRDIIPHILKTGSWFGEVTILDKQGQEIPAWEYFLAHHNPEGRVDYISGVVRDLRPQKRIELELRQRELALQLLNEGLEARVADRTKQLEEVNSNLETFAFSVSHDLKAPLRGIDGYSRLLEEEFQAQLPAEAHGFIHNIRQAAQSMSALIDDLLAYSRLGRRELSCSRFSIRTAVDRVLKERQHDLKSHHVTLDNHLDDRPIEVDLECFLQLMRNLIDNAIKFTRQQALPHITLRSECRESELVISVQDNGCGFDMTYHDRIFTIFQRLHRAQDYPGTGVGLAIVHKAAERMNGRVWAQSAPNQGATFYVALPYLAPPP